ncbi:uncharacterized protein TIGR03905 [Anaerobranca californiensis DSM 14826]|uniref:ribonucleoside-diphosphate reductase n=1 Tax=Anaerobranca californiensis DSM 14826 TaxID=1120989 RepID=A0A1M6M3K0_9FIRM|nr:TIGR03905 family TSCPD domain-containing protein [Anaerobranca californiensis]SHJ77995.1 uncharacterized protein TIGR03905 [Anaerobranca californiensis DSM 14826]
MVLEFKTQGVCSQEIIIEVKDGIVVKVEFIKGCKGNVQGIAKLAEGRRVEEIIEKLSGIQCRNGTSCPDQLARALQGVVA